MPKKLLYDDEGSMKVLSQAAVKRAVARIPDHLKTALDKSRQNLLAVKRARQKESGGRK